MDGSKVTSRAIIAVALLMLAAVSPLAVGADSLPDGTFATGIDGWVALGPNAAVAFDTDDADGSPTSGSLKVTNSTPGDADNYTGAQACYGPAAGDRRYPVFVDFKLPAQDIGGGVEFIMRFYEGADCTGTLLNDPGNGQGQTVGNIFFPGPKEDWSSLRALVSAPPLTQSMAFRILVTKRNSDSDQPTLPYFALVDNVAIGVETGTVTIIPMLGRD